MTDVESVAAKEGGCLCGRIRYRFTAEPTFPHYCSCRMCQKASGAPVTAWIDVAQEGFSWSGEGGEPTWFQSSKKTRRAFCPICGGSLAALDKGSSTISVMTATLDDPGAFPPTSHSFPKNGPKWLKLRPLDSKG